MQPITAMRNAMGPEHGGSGIPIDKDSYMEAYKYWNHHANVKWEISPLDPRQEVHFPNFLHMIALEKNCRYIYFLCINDLPVANCYNWYITLSSLFTKLYHDVLCQSTFTNYGARQLKKMVWWIETIVTIQIKLWKHPAAESCSLAVIVESVLKWSVVIKKLLTLHNFLICDIWVEWMHTMKMLCPTKSD